ncbi:MAG: AraC family transcriptional regulator [Pyrinomonadaceae bacterium]
MSPSSNQPNRFFVCPLYSVYYRRQKRFEWNSEAHAEYEIILLLEGKLTVNSAGATEELLKGQSFLLNPPASCALSGKAVELLQILLSPTFVSDHAVRMHLLGTGAMVVFAQDRVAGDARLQEWGQSLATELKEARPGGAIVIAALVEQVLVHLLRHYANMRRSHDLELSRAGLVDRRIRRSVELMHAQLGADLSLKEIAAASYLSPFHFARVFKKLTGATPHAYLAAVRTARAQLLLTNPELSVREIGALVGYASPSHFTKAFRQATGLTPRAFRNALVGR